MRLFKQKVEEKKCCCGGNCDADSMKQAETLKKEKGIKILGSGCNKCNQLEMATIAALAEMGLDTTIEHVSDFALIASYGVMSTPALVVDGAVMSYGKVLKKEEIMTILEGVIR